jgi:hypothetical protein
MMHKESIQINRIPKDRMVKIACWNERGSFKISMLSTRDSMFDKSILNEVLITQQ